MNLKLNNLGINRAANPKVIIAMLTNEQGESVTVHVKIESHVDLNTLTLGHIEHLAHEAAKKLHP